MNPVSTLETAKAVNPLKQLQTFGQSIWLDYIRRDLLKGGELQRLIDDCEYRSMCHAALLLKNIDKQNINEP